MSITWQTATRRQRMYMDRMCKRKTAIRAKAQAEGIPTFAKLFALARLRNNFTDSQVCQLCGIPTCLEPQARAKRGCRIQRLDRFISLGRLAGLRDVETMVLFVREEIPAKYAHLKPFIGATVRTPIKLFPHSKPSAKKAAMEMQEILMPQSIVVPEPEVINKLLPRRCRGFSQMTMKGGAG